MNTRRFLIALTSLFLITTARAEEPAASTATSTSEHSSGGLKAMKNASRRDPVTIEVDLTSPDPQERAHAAQALGHMGTSAEATSKSLMETLTDFATYHEDGNTHIVSVEAAQALRLVDPKGAVSPKTLARLVRAASLPTNHEPVQSGWAARCNAQPEALATLAALGPLAQSTLPDVVRLNQRPCTLGKAFLAAQAIGTLTDDQIPQLETALGDADIEVRRSVAEYIGAAHVAGGASALGKAMNDTSSAVRLAALESLESIHPEGQGRVPLVKPFLQDDSSDIRREALRLLLRLAPESPLTLALLKERLADSDNSLVIECAQALARVQPRNPKLLEALIRLAKNTESETGMQAAELLKSSGSRDPKVVEALDPYHERERQELIEKAVLTSTPEERAANARTVRVNAIRIAKGIKSEQPDHAARVFAAKNGRLYCWTSVSARVAPATLRHVWYLDGHPFHEATLVVPDSVSHIWSSCRIRAGKWRVEVLSPDSSEPIASASFTVIKE